jgi:lipopolysaccharide transport system ATP-binding protein
VRLAFAVAAHLDAEILLMDEVLAVGDAEFQKKALGKMGDVAKSGRTVLFVSHNMGAMKSLCGCGVVLEYGRIKAASDNIDRLAMNYLNNFGQNRPYTKWVNNGALQDPNFNPISLELQEEDGSAINSGISADKNYIVKLVFEIKEIDYLMNFWLSVFDMGDNCLFSIFPQGDKNYKPKAGLSTIYFTLPKGILGVQEYLINLASSIHNVRWIVDPQTHLVSITVPVTHKEILPMVGQGLISPYIKVFLE